MYCITLLKYVPWISTFQLGCVLLFRLGWWTFTSIENAIIVVVGMSLSYIRNYKIRKKCYAPVGMDSKHTHHTGFLQETIILQQEEFVAVLQLWGSSCGCVPKKMVLRFFVLSSSPTTREKDLFLLPLLSLPYR